MAPRFGSPARTARPDPLAAIPSLASSWTPVRVGVAQHDQVVGVADVDGAETAAAEVPTPRRRDVGRVDHAVGDEQLAARVLKGHAAARRHHQAVEAHRPQVQPRVHGVDHRPLGGEVGDRGRAQRQRLADLVAGQVDGHEVLAARDDRQAVQHLHAAGAIDQRDGRDEDRA